MTAPARRLLLASRARHKVRELQELLDLAGVTLLTPDDLGIEGEPVEDADTFAGNAEIKVRFYAERSGLPTLADDSGLEVDALGGRPGVFTRRYAGPDATDAQNNARLLEELDGVPAERRTARYHCVLAFLDPAADSGTAPVFCHGTFEGRIADHARGSGGFGYDPIFEPAFEAAGGRTVGQMSAAEKHAHSHRGQAARAMAEHLRGEGWSVVAPSSQGPGLQPADRPLRPRVVVGGEALIDLIVDQAGRVIPAPGGGQYNAARAIARLGGDVHFLGRVSDDWFGRLLLGRLESDGVGTDLVVPTTDPTTLVLAEIDAQGVAHYHWYIEHTTVPGLALADARCALVPPPDALHVGTLGLTMEPVADSLAALVAAVPATTFVMVDPNCRPTATPDVAVYRDRMGRVLGRADVVKGSDEDFAFLALADSPEASARLLLERGVGAVIVTQGGRPTRAWCAGGSVEVPVPVVDVVDTVGAGDAFGGAFLARWLELGLGRAELADVDRLEEAVAFAVRAAAINCTRAGAEPPTRAEMGLA